MNKHGALNFGHPDNAIAQRSGLGNICDAVNDLVGNLVRADNFQTDLFGEIRELILNGGDRAMSRRCRAPLGLADRHAGETLKTHQGLADLWQFIGSDDRFDFFHGGIWPQASTVVSTK